MSQATCAPWEHWPGVSQRCAGWGPAWAFQTSIMSIIRARGLTPTPEITTSNMSFWHQALADFRRKVRKPFYFRLIWFYDQIERNSSLNDDHLLYVGSFYLSVSLSFSNLDQYLDFLLPCEVSLILQTQPSTRLVPARYITAITEQLSPPPGPLSAVW